MSIFSRFFLLALLLAALQRPAQADALQFDRYIAFCSWSATERELLEDLADGELADFSVLEAALIIAGHDAGHVVDLKRIFSDSLARCSRTIRNEPDRNQRIRILFKHLNDEFLHGNYQPDLYDVGRTLNDGDFNCLTATILFHSLCQAHAIEVQAIWEPSHVQCWVPTSESSGILVETTASHAWSAVGPHMAASKLVDRRLSTSELIAKVFYNRGVCELRKHDYQHALAMTWASSLLDPGDKPAQHNLRACFNNWALKAFQQNDLELAKKLLEEGLNLAPDYAPLSRNRAMLIREIDGPDR